MGCVDCVSSFWKCWIGCLVLFFVCVCLWFLLGGRLRVLLFCCVWVRLIICLWDCCCCCLRFCFCVDIWCWGLFLFIISLCCLVWKLWLSLRILVFIWWVFGFVMGLRFCYLMELWELFYWLSELGILSCLFFMWCWMLLNCFFICCWWFVCMFVMSESFCLYRVFVSVCLLFLLMCFEVSCWML